MDEYDVDDYMKEIIAFDCTPAVYRVSLVRPSYLNCYEVVVEFRGGHGERLNSFCSRGNTPVSALGYALKILKDRYSKCPHCGKQLKGEP